ncbi:MAG: TIGR02996 domain-containing protein [Myxococcaceae bacterium]|jgi:uncharacterized protein (TIGR02996 family)|nr:TIGR02996 domain-containing protein [Myxococcaceae bacterium]MCA3015380.1 TIGR02996 domain-containing protein [Myxococcaceae bacterium]
MTEDELLRRIAERPFDPEPRLVFADFLAEQGDPRAEVIAMAARGRLSGVERRRLRRLVQDHSRRWLGPLERIADPATTSFVDGFLHSLVLGFGARSADLTMFLDEPRLATVRVLDVSTVRTAQPLSQFIRQSSFGAVERFVTGRPGLTALEGAPLPFTLSTLGVANAGFFEDALLPLGAHAIAQATPRWDLVSQLLFASLHAVELFARLREQLHAARGVRELRLVVPHGVFEGIGTWLAQPRESQAELVRRWPNGERWSVEAPGVVYALVRDATGGFPHLDVELSGEWARDIEDSIARLISVLVLLGPCGLTTVSIRVPPGLLPNREHRLALKAAARRLRGAHVTMDGETLSP